METSILDLLLRYWFMQNVFSQNCVEGAVLLMLCLQLLNFSQSYYFSLPFFCNSFTSGGPGSGKGTQTAKIAAHYDFECVSVGEILRNQLLHHAPSDRKWELIAQIIANGELAPQVWLCECRCYSSLVPALICTGVS